MVATEPMDERNADESNGTDVSMERTAVKPWTWSVGVLAARLGAAGVAPTSTMLGVTRLAIPDLMVELEGTAVA